MRIQDPSEPQIQISPQPKSSSKTQPPRSQMDASHIEHARVSVSQESKNLAKSGYDATKIDRLQELIDQGNLKIDAQKIATLIVDRYT